MLRNKIQLFLFVGISSFMIFEINSQSQPSNWDEYDILKTIIYNETDGKVFDFKLKVKRYNKTTYVITGGIDVNFDTATGLDAEIEFWHSAAGNNQYQLTPYRVPRKPICEFFNGEYRKLLMHDLHAASKLPYSDNDKEDLCPQLTRGKYELENFILRKEAIPPTMDKGMYKAVVLIFKGIEILSGAEVYAKLF